MLIVLTAILALCGAVQVVVIIRLVSLRKQFGHLPQLINQPGVRRWMRVCRCAVAVGVLTGILAAVITHGDAQAHFFVGLGLVLPLIPAHIVADNSTGHGDGDSGG